MASARVLTSNWKLSKKLLFSTKSTIATCLRQIHSKPLVVFNQKRRLSHHPPFPYPEIPSEKSARNLVVHLDDKGRALLLKELQKFEKEKLQLSGILILSAFLAVQYSIICNYMYGFMFLNME